MTPRVAVIGAGLAGLTVAERLLAKNVEIVLIDKGRHAGGRLCTRSISHPGGIATFDLGPQVLYARSTHHGLPQPQRHFRRLAESLLANPLCWKQVARLGAADEETPAVPPSGLAVPGGMREVAFRMLSRHGGSIEFHDHTLAEKVERTSDGWRIQTRSLRDGYETYILAHLLILTAPVPQCLELLASSKIGLPDDLRGSLRKVQYSKCLAIYGLFQGETSLPPGGVWLGSGDIEWIVDNHLKGSSDTGPAITALTTDAWAQEHWDEADSSILQQLLPQLRPWVGAPVPHPPAGIQRWRWARPIDPIQATCAVIRDQLLILAGDGFNCAAPDPADAAILSGEAAARRAAALITRLARQDDRLTLAQPSRYTLEIAVSTPNEAIQASLGGADRLELSSGLEVGGLTPSIATFRRVRDAVSLPIYVLVRPRPGGFEYSQDEFEIMCQDGEEFMREGAAGLVFGFVNRYGIDQNRCKEMIRIAREHAVFHRGFDLLPDSLAALDQLIELGFERVLTSGHARTAEAGTTRLTALVQHAGWQIEVLPAGNIRPSNVTDLVRETRCDQVHSSARELQVDPGLAPFPRLTLDLGTNAAGQLATTSMEVVRGLRNALDGLALRDEEKVTEDEMDEEIEQVMEGGPGTEEDPAKEEEQYE